MINAQEISRSQYLQMSIAEPMLMDYHVHDYRSRDAPNATIEKYIEQAEKRGIKEIVFTTHLIIDGPDISTGIRSNEIEDYLNDIWKAREETDVELKAGFEVDYFYEKEPVIDKLVNEYDLDFVLGSVHTIDGKNIGVSETSYELFENKSVKSVIEDYFKQWGYAVESEIFDVMSHPDYFRKFLPVNAVEWGDYGENVLKALDALKSYNVGFEINTSGFRHGIEDKFPVDDFIYNARDIGISTITLGSDSHYPGTLGYKLLDAAIFLKKEGFRTVSTFKSRRESRVPIDNIFKKTTPSSNLD
ncbi:histidinol-phosphatase HisJ family protein [Candidatus Bathyarchaeota archaeon]|nr:histidinol-phosphatase HisJ family protein [Candidatus Bathyarchaeota archaeon]